MTLGTSLPQQIWGAVHTLQHLLGCWQAGRRLLKQQPWLQPLQAPCDSSGVVTVCFWLSRHKMTNDKRIEGSQGGLVDARGPGGIMSSFQVVSDSLQVTQGMAGTQRWCLPVDVTLACPVIMEA